MDTIKELNPVIKLCACVYDMSTEKVRSKDSLVIDFSGNTKQKTEENAPFFENRKKVQVLIEMEDLPYLILSMQRTVNEWATKQHEKINTIQSAFKP